MAEPSGAPLAWRPPDPWPLPLVTERLRMRFFEPQDAAGLQAAVDASRDRLLPWLSWARDGHRTVEASLAVIEHFARQRGFVEADEFALGVFDRATSEVVGATGFHRVQRGIADAEVGYWVRADRQRQGIATEATAALVSSGFRDWGFRRVRLVCMGDNVASRRVAERVGFRREAVEVRATHLLGAGWQDRWRFALLAEEWDAERGRPKRSGDGRGASAKGFGATDPRIPPYVERLLEPEDDALREIRARSVAAGLPPIAVGPFDGRHLEVIARAVGARKVVEIGTLGGYSGVCLARALPRDGVLHTFEVDPKHARVAEESFRRARVADRVRLHVGPALERLPEIERDGPFDLVFVDADKAAYPAYLEWSARNLRPGGVLLADNVFRRAAFPLDGEDPRVGDGIKAFNAALAKGDRFRATLLPLEDGLAFGVRLARDAR
jgi:caffeoyl-CoA O-methyltransferase